LGYRKNPHRQRLRPEDGDQLGGLACGVGLGWRQDLQALPQNLAAGRDLGPAPPLRLAALQQGEVAGAAAAWKERRKRKQIGVEWPFTTADARIKVEAPLPES